MSSTPATTHTFLVERGVESYLLQELVAMAIGNAPDPEFLEGLAALLDHGCFRNVAQLRTAIRDYVAKGNNGVSDNADYIRILADTRTFTDVRTGDTFLEYVGTDDATAIRLEELLGDTVPEWFFPALCVVARRTNSMTFAEEVAALLQLWEICAIPASRTAAEFLEFYRPVLERKAEDAQWVVPQV